MAEAPGVVLTDPKPLPQDGRCPACAAPTSLRVALAAFGGLPREACSRCGYEFPKEAA